MHIRRTMLLILAVGFICCKDSKKSNTGASEYDKLMNKEDIVLDEESPVKQDEKSITDKATGTEQAEFDTDVQFLNGTPMYDLSSGYNLEEHERFLAATKLCWSYDYKATLGETRMGNHKNGKERINITSCCASFVPSPYISPFEYYYSLYHGNTDIRTYQNNVFKLQEIRSNLLSENFETFQQMVQNAQTDNLESYTLCTSNIQNYDIEKEELEIRYYVSNNSKVGSSSAKVKSLASRYQSSVTHYIPMSAEKAKAIYEHYASLNDYSKNPPFQLITKTTYLLGIPSVEKRPYNFEIGLRKIEFFKSGSGYPEPEDKIGEIQFVEKPNT
ncbi:hypothetical protein ACOCEA_04865 [Maribacter sp. CXY002]|uniref:hypothetical protein n=1 Tax=Maribacter luteocoastalis TaxID=3407671 RepID=UPI003B681B6E